MKIVAAIFVSVIALILMSAVLAWGLHSNLEAILGREFSYGHLWGACIVLLAFFGPQNNWRD